MNDFAPVPFAAPGPHPEFGYSVSDTKAVAVGDVDNDGDLDIVSGNGSPYKNTLDVNMGNGYFLDAFTTTTFITEDVDPQDTYGAALGDVDKDGYLDLVVGNVGVNRLYLNDGSATFDTGSDITSDSHTTLHVALGDVDRDGDLDLLAANYGGANRLYLNDGSGGFPSGSNITGDAGNTVYIELADVNGDGYLDVVAANDGGINRLYLNDGSGGFPSGTNITTDAHGSGSIAVGDVDRDGDLDLMFGNWAQPNRLYLNDGAGDPFDTASGSDVTSDAGQSTGVVLEDMNRDGHLDLVVGNNDGPNRLYLNDGSGGFPTGRDVNSDSDPNYAPIVVADMDGDGDPDIVAGDDGGFSKVVLNQSYDTGGGEVQSLKVNDTETNIARATLNVTDTVNTASTRNTDIQYYLSNNGGAKWLQAYPGVPVDFLSYGSDVRWKAELSSLSPVISPNIDGLGIEENEVAYNSGTATNLRDSFGTLDANGDGMLSLAEAGFGSLAEMKPYDENLDEQLTMADLLELTVGPVGVANPVYVDFGYAGTESGTLAEPFNSLLEAVVFVANNGAVNIAPGNSTETLVIDKDVSLVPTGGTVTIGAP